MTFKGKIEQIFPVMEMKFNNETSKKVEFLLNIEAGKFPKSIVIEVWNDKIQNSNIAVGNEILVDAILKSRKVGDRYFNNITAQKIEQMK